VMSDQIKDGDNVMHPKKRDIGTVRYVEGRYAVVLFGKKTGTYLLADLIKVKLKTEDELRREYAQKKA